MEKYTNRVNIVKQNCLFTFMFNASLEQILMNAEQEIYLNSIYMLSVWIGECMQIQLKLRKVYVNLKINNYMH